MSCDRTVGHVLWSSSTTCLLIVQLVMSSGLPVGHALWSSCQTCPLIVQWDMSCDRPVGHVLWLSYFSSTGSASDGSCSNLFPRGNDAEMFSWTAYDWIKASEVWIRLEMENWSRKWMKDVLGPGCLYWMDKSTADGTWSSSWQTAVHSYGLDKF